MLTKGLSHEIKDLDDSEGIVAAYANAYNNEDSDKDISAFGSFTKTVSDNFKRIRVLKDHITTISLGVPVKINANDPYGLFTETKFNLKKEVARDMFSDIKLMKENGLNAELSIGYDIVKRDQKDKRIITEYKLMEYSFLTSWAANELATVQGLKGLQTHYGLMEFITKAYNLPHSDQRLIKLEEILKSLTTEPIQEESLITEPTTEQIKEIIHKAFKI